MFNINKTKANYSVNKTFSYEGKEVNLSFTLPLDNKAKMESFLELLKIATDDVEKELAK